MPADTPLVSLGPDLMALLLRSLLWLAGAGVVVAAATWLLARRRGHVLERVRGTLFGPPSTEPEPPARRFLRVALGALWVIDGLLQAQPHMPAGFVRDMIAPSLSASPGWVASLVNPLTHVWTEHPVAADAAVLWVQIGIGVLIIVGGRGRLTTAVLWGSVVWGGFIWVTGEVFGGLTAPGASWLVGAPGAVLAYVVAAVLLLAPEKWWASGRAAVVARRAVAVWMLAGVVLQAVPWEGFWTASGISGPFVDGAAVRQPSLLRQPISWLATVSRHHPVTVNLLVIVALVAVGLALWLSGRLLVVAAGLVLCLATWWLGQDFGVLGGLGTDPNAALPLALLLGCALPYWSRRPVEQPVPATAAPSAWKRQLEAPVVAGLTASGFGAALVAPLVVIGILLGPADTAAVAADSGGGVVAIPGRAAPPFALTDQHGHAVSSASLRGKLTLLTFLDPVCSDDCPVIANQLAQADRELGPLAGRVEIVAIDSNPLFHNVADVAAFTTSHGLAQLPNWHFLAGPESALQDTAAAYGIAIDVPTVGMIEHGEGIYFLGADGKEVAYLGDGADVSLTTSYAQVVRDEVRRLLA